MYYGVCENGEQTFLACMFCFPITDHVMLPLKTVSYKSRAIHVHIRAYLMKRQKAKSPENFSWSGLGK